MKQIALALLLAVAPAYADEPQLDHAYGSSASPHALAFSPDATKLAVAGSDGVKIYETATGRVLETRPAGRLTTDSVAWSPDGRSLAAGGRTFTAKHVGEIWVWRTGQKPLHWTTGETAIESLAWSPDSRTLATAGGSDFMGEEGNGTACLWDASSGHLKRTLGAYYSSNASIAFSSDGKVVGFSSDGERSGRPQTTVCDVVSGRVLKRWEESAIPLHFNGHNPLLAKAPLARDFKDGFERRIEVSYDKDFRYRFVAHKAGAVQAATDTVLGIGDRSAKFGGDYLAATMKPQMGDDTKTTGIWKISGQPPRAKFLREIGRRTSSPLQLVISSDRKTLALGSRTGTTLFDANFSDVRPMPPRNPKQRWDDPRLALSLSADGKRVFDGRWLDGSSEQPKVVVSLDGVYQFAGREAVLSPDGQILAGHVSQKEGAFLKRADGSEVELRLPPRPQEPGEEVEEETEEEEAEEEEENGRPVRFHSGAWAPDSSRLVVLGGINHDAPLPLFDVKGQFLREFKVEYERIDWTAAAFSPDSQRLVAAGNSESGNGMKLCLWKGDEPETDLQIDLKEEAPDFPGGGIGSLAFSPDGTTIGAGGVVFSGGVFAPCIQFFDSSTGNKIGSLPQKLYEGQTWVFLDARRVALLNGNAIEVWDFRTHQREKSVFIVPKPGGLQLVSQP